MKEFENGYQMVLLVDTREQFNAQASLKKLLKEKGSATFVLHMHHTWQIPLGTEDLGYWRLYVGCKTKTRRLVR